ncbi:MAG: UbiX family flavin prenyltransferase [Anaerolineales bacterium]|jgi:4-hydroxy-3-polyprenylbenzoate decarboxylase
MGDQYKLVVGITGASGVIYGIRFLEVLKEIIEVQSHLVISKSAKQTIGLETKHSINNILALADKVYDIDDITAPIASGSYLTSGMVVIPCSIKSLSAITNSYNNNLLIRAADVTLKERRKLIIVPRETPLHLGHLRLMVGAAEIGAVILPPIPALYNHPHSIQDIIDQTVMRVLDLLNITPPAQLTRRWGG